MTGQRQAPDVVSAIKQGAAEFIEKPFTDDQLLAALHRGFVALGRKDGDAAGPDDYRDGA